MSRINIGKNIISVATGQLIEELEKNPEVTGGKALSITVNKRLTRLKISVYRATIAPRFKMKSFALFFVCGFIPLEVKPYIF
jgi:hypothetical protein